MAKQHRSLTGRMAAVTGGARGIGLATATALARQGMKVAIGDLDVARAATAAAELGSGAIGLPLDVTSRESFEAFVAAAEERLGPLEVLVNNAGIMPLSPFALESDAAAAAQVDINLHGVIFGCKIALERFLERGHGHIVNIASAAGKSGFPGAATYAATKHAVVGLSESIRQEVRGTDIRVSIVMPALVNTELASGLERGRGVKRAEPEEVAAAIVEALQTGRVDVWVPRSLAPILSTAPALPRRLREGIARGLKADRVLTQVDRQARDAYELRAAKSDPRLEPGDEPKLLTPGD